MSPSKKKRDRHRVTAHARHKGRTESRGRSAASRLLSRQRRAGWLAWRADCHSILPDDKVWLLHRLSRSCFSETGDFGKFLATPSSELPKTKVRQRDIFPLVQIADSALKPADMTLCRWKVLLTFINVVIGALNWLYGAKRAALAQRPTLAQKAVLANIVQRSVSTLSRLQGVREGWERFVPDFVPGSKQLAALFQDLVADRVDNLETAALCDPLNHVPDKVRNSLNEPDGIFDKPSFALGFFDGFSRGDRDEYAKLVVRQLRSGKLGLSISCKGGGASFAVGKPGGDRLREVWHGKLVSEAACPPPKPRHLASPTALALLECSDGRPFRLSKRDATCWFDQLKLPVPLRAYMAKPPLSTEELKRAGMSVHEQQQHMEEGQVWREGMLFPLHHVWPMGFSWSSYIAQEEMLSVCQAAGIEESSLLACDSTTPPSFGLVAGVATDDVMFFSNAGPGVTSEAVRAFDKAMEKRGAVRNPRKDVDDELSGTCVGVDLVDGYFLDVPAQRYLSMVLTVLRLRETGVGSPKQIQQILGALQWFDLLVRPKLSVYSAIYQFTLSGSDAVVQLPASVLAELVCSVCLGIFWRCDLRRPFLPLLGATDASLSFGFGGSVVHASETVVRTVARWAEKQGAFVVMDGEAAKHLSTERLLEARFLDVKLDKFSDIFSVRNKFPAHINVLEGEAFVLFLRWLLRSYKNHSARVVVLLDSAAFLGAAAKGRSSSQLNRLLRKTAALAMAGDIQLHLIFVPSSENPADRPSRGKRRADSKLS